MKQYCENCIYLGIADRCEMLETLARGRVTFLCG